MSEATRFNQEAITVGGKMWAVRERDGKRVAVTVTGFWRNLICTDRRWYFQQATGTTTLAGDVIRLHPWDEYQEEAPPDPSRVPAPPDTRDWTQRYVGD